MSKKKIYALLVGINDYAEPIPKLSACENDVEKVKAYLEGVEGVEVKFKILLNEKATKTAIARGFTTFLSKAKEGEVALFYFSGHGTREIADEVFWETDPDQKLQCLIPSDVLKVRRGKMFYNLLANKELRFLIHQVSLNKPHIITIFDCCHAGGSSRDVNGAKKRQYLPGSENGTAFPKRKWSDFIFSKQLRYEQFKTDTVQELIPEGPHIQLAAALPDESAFETLGSGVFTKHLIETLKRAENKISYSDLQSLIRNYIRNDFKQTPLIYVSKGESAFRNFLDLIPVSNSRNLNNQSPVGANVSYHNKLGWIMDIGRLHGITKSEKEILVNTLGGGKNYPASLKEITSDYCVLEFKSEVPDQSGMYKVFLNQFLASPIAIYLNNQEKDEKGLRFLKDKIDLAGNHIHLVDKEQLADYTVHLKNDTYNISLPKDAERPLTAPISLFSPASARMVAFYLKHISEWEFVKNLYNPSGFLFESQPIKVELIKTNGEHQEIRNEIISMDYEWTGEEYSGQFKIKLTNEFHQKLFVSFLYLSMDFMVYSELIPQGVIGIEPGQSILINDGEEIELDYEEQVDVFNWKHSISYFKLIANTRFTDISKLEMDALPGPLESVTRSAGRGSDEEVEDIQADDWITRLITLKLRNPNYKED